MHRKRKLRELGALEELGGGGEPRCLALSPEALQGWSPALVDGHLVLAARPGSVSLQTQGPAEAARP